MLNIIKTIDQTQASLILKGVREIPEVIDIVLKKLVCLICKDILKHKFKELVIISYDHFDLWLIRYIHEKPDYKYTAEELGNYIESMLYKIELENGNDYELGVICDNSHEIVITIAITP